MKLISFLGRVPKDTAGYRQTTYEFADGSKSEPVSYIVWPLIERLKPESMVILGTEGSMWDHLFDSIECPLDEDLHLELLAHVDNKSVSQALLDQLQQRFTKKLGIACELVIIPYGKDMNEQIQIMEIIAQFVSEKDNVVLDVTHGFRHLPMLGLISAQYLQRLKSAKIKGIYYGMYDPDLKIGEVYDLQGMLQLNNWVFALSQFDKDGDYSVFSEPLAIDGFSPVGIKALNKAAYFERIFNVSQAKQQLSTFSLQLENNLPGAGKLFTKPLKDRVAWAKSNTLHKHQCKLAWFYLTNGDYVRACIFALEAFNTSLLKPHETDQQQNFSVRKQAALDYKDNPNSDRGDKNLLNDYEYLSRIRNALAHGTEPNSAIGRAMKDSEIFTKTLTELFNKLGIKP